jgi:hypothetical protein
MKPLAAIPPIAAALLFGAWLAPGVAGQQPNPPVPTAPASQNSTTSPQSPPQQPASAPQPASLANPSTAQAQNSPASQPSIATVSLEGVSLSGSLSVEDGFAVIGNNGAVSAGDKTARVSLTRGGFLNVCASTKIHLSTDIAISGGGLMIAIDRGALEANYLPGQYSDVLLTPDLRILISGPGQAHLSLRVNNDGDTCVDNHGDNAPYVLASNLFEGGAYRVKPNQRVLFLHGSLQQIVDNEKESCGCPPPPPTPAPTSIAKVGMPGGTLHSSDESPTPPPPNATSAAAQNPFPLAESEGLQPPPPPATPVVQPGEAHAQITAPLVYNGETSLNVGMPAASLSGTNPSSNAACNDPLYPGVVCDAQAQADDSSPETDQPKSPPSAGPAASGEPAAPAAAAKPKKKSGFAHFLRRIFGNG